jgi:hypothetical protein
VLTGDELVDLLHRAGAVERVHGDDVLELRGPQPLQHPAHPRRLQLEGAQGVSAAEGVEGGGVVQRHGLDVDIEPPGPLHHSDAGVDDVQVAQAQEVHLQQAQLLDRGHFVLGDDRRLVGGAPLQGHARDDRVGCDDHAGSVGADASGDALEPLGGVDQLFVARVRLVDMAQLGHLLHRLLQRYRLALEDRHHLGDGVDLGDGNIEDPADVADGGLAGHRAEGADLGDAVLAVLLGDIADHRLPPGHREVDVDIGHRYAVLV